MRKLRIRKGALTKQQILFAAVLGVASGIYIWNPILADYARKQSEQVSSKSEKQSQPEQTNLTKDHS